MLSELRWDPGAPRETGKFSTSVVVMKRATRGQLTGQHVGEPKAGAHRVGHGRVTGRTRADDDDVVDGGVLGTSSCEDRASAGSGGLGRSASQAESHEHGTLLPGFTGQ